MKRTLTNIDGRIILKALRQANPVTAQGKAAVENYRRFLTVRTMNAIALENSIVSLEHDINDAGLAGLTATLKGIIPVQKRYVAIAYEQLAAKPAGMFMGATNECMAALESLYDRNATEIISAINDGVLDAFAVVPEVARLIRWAKSAQRSDARKGIVAPAEGVTVNMVPVLNLASAGEDMLISVDGKAFLQSKGGALTYIPDAVNVDVLTDDVRRLVRVLDIFKSSEEQPNVLELKPEVLEYVRKALPVKSLGIDLLGGVNELVVMNDTPMDADKATRLLMSDNDKLIASKVLDDGAKDAITLLSEAFMLVERYRDVIMSNKFAYKFSTGDKFSMYVLEQKHGYAAIVVVNGSVVSAKSYNSIYDLLASDMVVANTPIYDTIANTYAEQLKHEAKSISVKKQLLEDMTNELREYEALLDRIKKEEEDMALVSDVNQEKVDQLQEVRKKTEEKLATIKEELAKLS